MAQDLDSPVITVLMPVFNGEKYLRLAMESILNQTFSDFEFLIVNDGSTDSSEAIIKSFSDSRIRLIQNTKRGLSNALNLGIVEAKGKYVARMDCDDIALPTRISKELEIFQKDVKIDVVSSFVTLINQDGKHINAWLDYGRAITNEEIIKQLATENCIAHPTVMAKRDVLSKHKYDTKQKYAEDWDLWLRIAAEGGKFYKIGEPLLLYRIHGQSAQGLVLHKSHYNKKAKTLGRYFINGLKRANLTIFDLKVLKNASVSFLRYLIDRVSPKMNRTLEQLFSTNPIKVISQYYQLRKYFLKAQIEDNTIYFFFPGAFEGSILDFYKNIISCYKDLNPVCLITSAPSEMYFNNSIENKHVIDISQISDYPLLQKWVKKVLSRVINKTVNPSVFGSNSVFYYNLLGTIGENADKLDLIYPINNPAEAGVEMLKYDFLTLCLPFTVEIRSRFVMNENQLSELREIYRVNNIDDKYLERITLFSKFKDLLKK